MNDRTIKILATTGLLMVSIVWGSAFVVMKISMDAITPTYLLAYRFTIASVGLFLIFWKIMKTMTWGDLKCGGMLGVLLFISYYFQTQGLNYTTASKNAFITTLYVIMVPFLHWIFNKVKPMRNNITAAVIAVVGLALLSLNGDLSVNFGDFLTFISGIFYALHMVFLSRYAIGRNPIKLTLVQMASAGGCAWVLAMIFEGPCDLTVFADTGVLMSILYLGLLSSMVCFLLQTVGQTYLSPNTASILLSFEAVFGLGFSMIFLKEILTGRMLVGCALMFAAAILAEYTPGRKKDEERERTVDGEIIIHS